ncbi:Methyltransferase, FkbM family [uncultured Candidatus Thioglobus sp.]|nr:Methyltransferase, FkbM family [uncultured Candidatus Thioglobus sp.]
MHKILKRIGYEFIFLRRLIYQNNEEKRMALWLEDQGDKVLRLNYDLNEESIVFDFGGYEGQWASDIFSKYCCFIHVFEAELQFSSNIENRFKNNNKIISHAFGLSNESIKQEVTISADGTSAFTTKRGEKAEITLVKATDFFAKEHITKIDLMKINIEGGEYDLLEHLIDTNFIKNIQNIQIQFHDFVQNAEERMIEIQKNLSKTHHLSYQYIFIWENWEINNT